MKIQPTGLILDHDYRNAYKDLILGGYDTTPIKDVDWSPQLIKAWQNWKPFCVSYAAAKNIMWYLKNTFNCSDDGLAILANTGKTGTWLNNVLGTAKDKGIWLQADFPNFENVSWADWDRMFNYDKTLDNKLRKFTDIGWLYLTPNPDILKREVQTKPIMISIGLNGSTWNTDNDVIQKPSSYTVYHETTLAGWKEGKGYKIHDSLQNHNGEYYLAPDYDILSGCYITNALPTNWQEIQQQNQPFQNCLNHYLKPRNIVAEQVVAGKMVLEFKKFNNESVWQAAGKFWTIYINAIVYGNYTYTDCINDCYNWRRTGNHIFNFDFVKL